MKKNYSELLELGELCNSLLSREGIVKSKLGYATKRFFDKNLKKVFEQYNEELQDIKIDNALTDSKTGAILYEADGKSFQFSKDSLKTFLKEAKKLRDRWDVKEFEIEPFLCKDIDGIELTTLETEMLTGLLI